MPNAAAATGRIPDFVDWTAVSPMNITPPPQGPPSVFLSSYSDAGKIWKVGELLRAVAVKQTAQNQLTLQIGNQRYTAHAQAPVKTGVPLLLRVVRAGTQPVLEVVPEANRSAAQISLPQQAAGPQQAPPPPLLSSLIKLSARPAQSQMPAGVIRTVNLVLDSLPRAQEVVDGHQLRRIMLNSGTFLESKLASLGGDGAESINQDWKVALLRLRSALRALVPPGDLLASAAKGTAKEVGNPVSQLQQRIAASLSNMETADEPVKRLLRQVDEALIRIEVNQLSSRPAEDPGKQMWLLEFPLRSDDRGADMVRIRVERDAQNAEDLEDAWRVSIHLDLGSYGHVAVTVALRQGHVSVQFAAETSETASLFQRHLHRLEKNLVDRGLKIGVLSSQVNTLPSSGGSETGSLDVIA